jgi:hypothetical protein
LDEPISARADRQRAATARIGVESVVFRTILPRTSRSGLSSIMPPPPLGRFGCDRTPFLRRFEKEFM